MLIYYLKCYLVLVCFRLPVFILYLACVPPVIADKISCLTYIFFLLSFSLGIILQHCLHYVGIGHLMGLDLRYSFLNYIPDLMLFKFWFLILMASLVGLLQDMVVLPYKDSLLLFSRYLQQLVMESLGKEFDLDGNRVCITV